MVLGLDPPRRRRSPAGISPPCTPFDSALGLLSCDRLVGAPWTTSIVAGSSPRSSSETDRVSSMRPSSLLTYDRYGPLLPGHAAVGPGASAGSGPGLSLTLAAFMGWLTARSGALSGVDRRKHSRRSLGPTCSPGVGRECGIAGNAYRHRGRDDGLVRRPYDVGAGPGLMALRRPWLRHASHPVRSLLGLLAHRPPAPRVGCRALGRPSGVRRFRDVHLVLQVDDPGDREPRRWRSRSARPTSWGTSPRRMAVPPITSTSGWGRCQVRGEWESSNLTRSARSPLPIRSSIRCWMRVRSSSRHRRDQQPTPRPRVGEHWKRRR